MKFILEAMSLFTLLWVSTVALNCLKYDSNMGATFDLDDVNRYKARNFLESLVVLVD